MTLSHIEEQFERFSETVNTKAGSPYAFMLAALSIVLWALSGFVVGFGNPNYQLVINTGTTIVTFLMTFILLSSQNKQSNALHLKLDELLRSAKDARNNLIDAEHQSTKTIEKEKARLKKA